MNVRTSDLYWDCACELPVGYIHRKQVRTKCPKCGVSEEDGMPDSRHTELMDYRNYADVPPVDRLRWLEHVVKNFPLDELRELAVRGLMCTTEDMNSKELFDGYDDRERAWNEPGGESMRWQREHPKANVPKAIYECPFLEDTSWHNDTMPAFLLVNPKQGAVVGWVDYPTAEESEHGSNGWHRYTIMVGADIEDAMTQRWTGDCVDTFLQQLALLRFTDKACRPIMDWLSYLPEDILAEVRDEVTKQYARHRKDPENYEAPDSTTYVEDAVEALYAVFPWCDTSRGFDYWYELSIKIERGEV